MRKDRCPCAAPRLFRPQSAEFLAAAADVVDSTLQLDFPVFLPNLLFLGPRGTEKAIGTIDLRFLLWPVDDRVATGSVPRLQAISLIARPIAIGSRVFKRRT